MNTYISIKGINYLIPNAVVNKYNEEFVNYSSDLNDNKYFDVNKVILDNKCELLKKIYHDSVNAVGIQAFSLDESYLDDYNRLIFQLKELDKLIVKLEEKEDNKLAVDKILDGLQVILDFYMRMLEEEEIEFKKR